MAHYDIIAPTEFSGTPPVVRRVSFADLKDALAKGISDFWAMPTHVVFICVIYPLIGLALARALLGTELVPLLYPAAAGFALVGPFAAIGLYELSRRREAGMDTSLRHVFGVLRSPSLPSILLVGLLMAAIFAAWIATAHIIYTMNFGVHEPASLTQFAREVMSTPEGWSLIVLGNLAGFVFAVLAFALTVISIPLLLDRNVGAAVAIATSVRVVLENPVTMAAWGLIVAASLAIGSLPLLIGLVFVLPVLGHSTWHLYRKAVAPDHGPRPPVEKRERGQRYAAEFPASLFVSTRTPRR